MPILSSLDQLKSFPFSPMENPKRVLMITPEYFSIEYSINPHMKNEDGTLKEVDHNRAVFQWEKLKEKIEELGLKVFTLPGQVGLPDMVFSANQSLPLDPKRVLIGKMASSQRSGEVQFVREFFENHGVEAKELPESVDCLEGTGDALWHHGMDLLWVGHGFRTSVNAVKYLGEGLDLAVAPLELVDESFYHLDTCMSILDSKTVAWIPKAFSEESQQIIDNFFPVRIEVPYEEGLNSLSCNCWSVDGKNVLVPVGSENLSQKLENHGFIVHELDSCEYLKAGGSLFCMKLAFF
jgi:N-dimethylarginine dimethylaminohydrolase